MSDSKVVIMKLRAFLKTILGIIPAAISAVMLRPKSSKVIGMGVTIYPDMECRNHSVQPRYISINGLPGGCQIPNPSFPEYVGKVIYPGKSALFDGVPGSRIHDEAGRAYLADGNGRFQRV